MDQRCGISRRPQFPDSEHVYKWIHQIVLTLPHNLPYNTEIDIPVIPTLHPKPVWPDWPEISLANRENFSRLLRNHMARKKSLDLIHHPEPN